jgi:hypothetical protein
MNDLITLDQAKAQLRIDDTEADAELAEMVTAASAVVVGYIGGLVAPTYTAETVPAPVRTAVLLVLSSLYQDREGMEDPLGVAVHSILRPFRDPALA